ncbi:hypothetical protein [Desulfovibrio gilichinskyi]|uniref:Uncharacterized protein n=1 Tax=Desulfovibrio gilichinskyi TaxID=1519643 RepID=A0A1X7CHI6_9BACT|nr:hypothetical protein [Desulfovibrio gilichinskyi]SME96454.1 hypothetical protein SAMN06295933_0890 [Desulfovibrio gilichinskyi]
MIPVSLILGFFSGGKGKLVIGLVVALILTVAIAGVAMWISSLNTDIAKLEKANAELNADIAGYKLEIRTGQTEITLLKQSRSQSTRVVQSLQGQLAKVQNSAKWFRVQRTKALKLLNSARNYPVTNSTGVISNEDSRLATEFINNTLGLHSQASQ